MRRQPWLRKCIYVDAFAGVGQYLDPEEQDYVDGSPLVALASDPPFDQYYFIDADESRLASLREHVQRTFPGKLPVFACGDANTVLRETVCPAVSYGRYERGFVFLDPYGLQVELSTVQQLAHTKVFDVLVNLSVMGINRLLQRDQWPDSATLNILGRVMGDTTWLEDVYSRQQDLFGEERVLRPRLAPAAVAKLYLDRIRKFFPYVSDPLLMTNSRDAPLYILFSASHNETAKKITDDIFARYLSRLARS